MPVTLEQAKLNTLTDYDPAIIDEFRKGSPLLDLIIFDTAVNPAGGGATLTYGYRRVSKQRSAAFREINTEYVPAQAETTQHTVDLVPLGGSFQIDRVLANLGPAASNEVAFQMAQVIKAANAKFVDGVINGDTAVDEAGFDGLDKALTGTTTEITGGKDWSGLTTADSAHVILDDLDELLSTLDGPANAVVGNARSLAKLRAAARRANMYTKAPVEGLLGANGRPVEREMIGDLMVIEAGYKPSDSATNEAIVPMDAEAGTTDLYAVRVALDGFHGVTTTNGQMLQTWLPDFSTAGAVKTGEVELGPLAVVLKSTKAAAVLRDIKL